ncbi:hypothetical protein GOARA_091_00340 [Gordonia araii NBRC 100433]|uniref:Tox-REase-5 domain-containing protein n=1 Tax=Gordonia araii NBRC 100433 TaxID=1073574 RepID=G7H7U1_9ACTN|nr:hypothetical protein [Gordonia araii]GAB11916.1 hypothetical protein GOARA_091_00340 [Gordonia araii NBRC 100433]
MFVVLGLFGTGILTVPTDGSAMAPAPKRAQERLDTATTSFTAAPGAVYSGPMGSHPANLDGFAVTATGDARGTVAIKGVPAEVLHLDGTTYVKASREFWSMAGGSGGPDSPKLDIDRLANNWAAVGDGLLGFRIGDLIPKNLGLAIQDGDRRIPGELGAPSGPASNTPDARGTVTGLPVNIEQRENNIVEAGTMATAIGPNGGIIGVLGPVGSRGDSTPETSRLKIRVMTNSEVLTFYSTVQGLTDPLKRVPMPGVDVPKPTGSLVQCGPGCHSVTYNFTNSGTGGADRATVSVQQTSNFTVAGAPAGSCQRSVSMPLGGRATSTCLFSYSPPRGRFTVRVESNFKVSAHVEKDVRVMIESLDRNKKIATGPRPGQWYPKPYKVNAPNRGYDRQITGNTSPFAYMVGGYPFDGIEPDGTLLMTAGPGYDAHVRGDSFDPAWPGTTQLASNAEAQRKAAGEAPVRWVFAEAKAAGAARKLLEQKRIEGIEVVVIPADR